MKSFKQYITESENNQKYFYLRAAIRHIPSGKIIDGDRHSTALKKTWMHYDISSSWGKQPDHPEGAIMMGIGNKFKENEWEYGFLTHDGNFETRSQSAARFGENASDSEGLVKLGHLPPYNTEVEEEQINARRRSFGI